MQSLLLMPKAFDCALIPGTTDIQTLAQVTQREDESPADKPTVSHHLRGRLKALKEHAVQTVSRFCSRKRQGMQAGLTDFSFSNALPPCGMCRRQPMTSPCRHHRHDGASGDFSWPMLKHVEGPTSV